MLKRRDCLSPLFALPFSGIEILPRSDEMLKRRDCLSPLFALPSIDLMITAGFHLHRPSEEKNHDS
ncbi:hypothetical protein PRIPAC_76059 [Pristionchus pacificus]|uniref:Uncharacterized protein n=1 Tax=Pristionchus pacificus TaxID=54126 RepID=A0A2A6CGD4_PRIPA|nr:hypothetical protein PRIPAC_76059 [Pristionchus pacificus]|eukprot:PDM77272.1 hypothetical protein PRIPAC_43184 [Pristionchus pacificus]